MDEFGEMFFLSIPVLFNSGAPLRLVSDACSYCLCWGPDAHCAEPSAQLLSSEKRAIGVHLSVNSGTTRDVGLGLLSRIFHRSSVDTEYCCGSIAFAGRDYQVSVLQYPWYAKNRSIAH